MTTNEIIDLYVDLLEKRQIPEQYKDPQEIINFEEHDEAADVFSLAMNLFKMITEKDFFDYIDIPYDEYLMITDFEASGAVICSKYIPDEYQLFSDLLEGMTRYKRNERIPYDKISEQITLLKTSVSEITEDKHEDDSNCRFWAIESEFDYGIIVNNKRIGKIEFRKLFDHSSGSTGCFVMPTDEDELFRIAVSKRHKNNANISNPSSVYGDCILPVGILEIQTAGCSKIEMIMNSVDNIMMILVFRVGSDNKGEYEIAEQQIRFIRV